MRSEVAATPGSPFELPRAARRLQVSRASPRQALERGEDWFADPARQPVRRILCGEQAEVRVWRCTKSVKRIIEEVLVMMEAEVALVSSNWSHLRQSLGDDMTH
jgi:hypothetical protein